MPTKVVIIIGMCKRLATFLIAINIVYVSTKRGTP